VVRRGKKIEKIIQAIFREEGISQAKLKGGIRRAGNHKFGER